METARRRQFTRRHLSISVSNFAVTIIGANRKLGSYARCLCGLVNINDVTWWVYKLYCNDVSCYLYLYLSIYLRDL